jgi:hypothetical protein
VTAPNPVRYQPVMGPCLPLLLLRASLPTVALTEERFVWVMTWLLPPGVSNSQVTS